MKRPNAQTPKRPNAQTPISATRDGSGLFVGCALALTLVVACSKTETELPASATNEAVDPGPCIRTFLNNAALATHGHQRDGEVYSIDSAVWYIEAGLNYSLTAGEREFETLITDSLLLEVPLINGTAPVDGVIAAYIPLHVMVMGLTTDMQHVTLVNVEVASQNSALLILNVICFIGSGYERAAPSTDYGDDGTNVRLWGQYSNQAQPNTGCRCGAQPTPSVKCLDKEIETRINVANPTVSGFYFTNVETWQVNGGSTDFAQKRYRFNEPFLHNPYDPTPTWDGCFGTRTFSRWTFYGCDDACQVVPNEIYWTNGTWAAINLIKGAQCPTKTFKVCMITSAFYIQPGILEQWDIHQCSFSYGIKWAK
ncbi:MAG: hypothetical protein IPO90_08920 [Flavobacteriales bacterium]|nr:hypothetical protein [Flavobacteriales bacterium]